MYDLRISTAFTSHWKALWWIAGSSWHFRQGRDSRGGPAGPPKASGPEAERWIPVQPRL